MIAYVPGDRVIVEDEHAIYTGEVVDLFAIIRPDRDDVGYVISLDGTGIALLALGAALWPGRQCEAPADLTEPDPDIEDGSHDWSRS